MNIQPYESILIIEDAKADYIKIERSLRKARLANPLIHIDHGDDALDYLTKSGKHTEDPSWIRPAIVLLDINLPGTDGIEILKAAKKIKSIKQIPIIMMTTSSDDIDIEKCYETGANSYIVKPFTSQGFFEAMEKIREYWFSLVRLPNDKQNEE